MQCIIVYAFVMYSSYLKSVLRYVLSILDNCHADITSLPSKDVGRIRGYFSKPKGVREQKGLGITAYSTVVADASSRLLSRPSVSQQ